MYQDDIIFLFLKNNLCFFLFCIAQKRNKKC